MLIMPRHPIHGDVRTCMPGCAKPDRRRCRGLEGTADAAAGGIGEVLIAIKAASLNFPDLLVVQGKYQIQAHAAVRARLGVRRRGGGGGRRRPPREAGDPVRGLRPAPRLCHPRLREGRVVMPLPRGFAFDDAAAFVLTYGTSHHALVDRAALKAGETLLVLGAAGGGARRRCRSARRWARVRDRGRLQRREVRAVPRDRRRRDHQLREREPARRAQAPDRRQGVDVVYDPVGGDLAEPVFRSIAWRGRYLVIGFAQGGIPTCRSTCRCSGRAPRWWACSGASSRAASRRPTRACWPSWRSGTRKGKVKPVIDQRLPHDRAARGLRAWALQRGKLVLLND